MISKNGDNILKHIFKYILTASIDVKFFSLSFQNMKKLELAKFICDGQIPDLIGILYKSMTFTLHDDY